MNAFASYAQAAIPLAQQRRQAKAEKPKSAFDLAMEEKQRLSRAYRRWKTTEARATLASEPRLRDFNRYLRSVKPEQADELIEAIEASWLPECNQSVRIYALRMISRHCDRLNQRMGNDVLDDPLPPETSTYFRARALLHNGGRA